SSSVLYTLSLHDALPILRRAKRLHDLDLTLFGKDGLEPQLGDALFAALLSDDGVGALAAEEGARALRVPGAALVLADPARAGRRSEEHTSELQSRFDLVC